MPTTTRSLRSVTPRQRDVLRLIADGQTTAEIAEELGLSVFTVKNYVERTFSRLGVYSRAGAVGMAMREGLLE
ncbi:MAG TPA: LuxR C-terminal-related transcriptional regulator [Actinomycetota bacterium]|nr:LuxR C-terminal-related transcriptional regulator [Actinomycetota bacterium]